MGSTIIYSKLFRLSTLLYIYMKLFSLGLPQLLLFVGVLPVVLGHPIALAAGRTPDAASTRQDLHQEMDRASSKSLPHLPFRHYPSEKDDELNVRARASRCHELRPRDESASTRMAYLRFKDYSSEKDDELEAVLCRNLRREESDSNRIQVIQHLPFRNYPSETEGEEHQSLA
ncbi:hypothetical protein MSAN_01137700 [Mycena sanguinolenta]|uniref:Uncharacterized protein n=1 Tax=Mycena sanguinolenta TaxID=230812 RepID=A0A8H6YH09_9AGAR|nr:hypothetical protein MSAN_01137700 [Mycena sanguinolenta]